MTRGAGHAGHAVKKPSRKAARPRRTAKTARESGPGNSSIDELRAQLEVRTRERDDALAQQTATLEVLKVISSSPGDLTPVFRSVLENATRICEAEFGTLFLYDGNAFRYAADVGAPQEYTDFQSRRGPFQTQAGSQLDQVLKTKRVKHTPDYAAESVVGTSAKVSGARTSLCVPMLQDGKLVGAVQIFRFEVQPFNEKQISLLEHFAAQAVIAIENTRLLNELRQRTNDLSEALEQQTVTSEVLRVISSSAGELEPVFNAILENATRICEASFGTLLRRDGDAFRRVALHGAPAEYAEFVTKNPLLHPDQSITLKRTCETKQINLVTDMSLTEAETPIAKLGRARTLLTVPMLKHNELIGAIGIYRQEVRPFTEKQTALVQNFAEQAVIAIENARLLNELRESLQQQTATADVLKTISRSTFDLQTVLDTLSESVARLCEAYDAVLLLRQGEKLDVKAHYGSIPSDITDWPINPNWIPGRAFIDRATIHIHDVSTSEEFPESREKALHLGFRTVLVAPLLRENEAIGVISIRRREVKPFTEKQIELVQTFADQAVIAIENVRLFDEVQARTRDLSESLEQQTATSEVLKVISSSPGELEPVFNAMLENATRICEAKFGNLLLFENGLIRRAAIYGALPGFADESERNPVFRPSALNPMSRLMTTKQAVHIGNLAAERGYLERDPIVTALVEKAGARTVIAVPMLKENELIGAIGVYRQEVRPFTEKQIELLKNFAAQAVIAIENSRLLNELRQRTDELAQRQAELRVTFDNMGDGVVMFDKELRLAAWNRNLQEIMDIPDAFFAESRTYRDYVNYLIERGEFAAERAAELARLDERSMREERFERTRPNGRILEVRRNPVPGGGFVLIFSDITERKQAEERVRAARDAAERALAELRAAQDRLVQTEKLASLGQLTAGIAHEIKNPLNFVNNFSGVSVELIDELQDALKGSFDAKTVTEITDLAETLRGNLDKIVQHGRRADAIVKNMLLHSRQGSAEHRPVDINALVEESLNLAWHGARAEQQGFNITLERSLDPGAGEADLFPQDITRVLLNLISNGFYAATRRKAQADGGDYEPVLAASTKDLGDRVEIRIRDNGTGIPPEVKEKMFNPFFTTKPAGEGTGLGLSISHDIVVKQHGGSIEVDTQPGEFTEIKITLPRSGVLPTEPPAAHA